jgi:glycosyltransferase involved in cell wall biosynthesis
VPGNVEIVVVDDHSKQPLRSLNYPNVKILRGKRKGYFSGAVNIGISNTRGDVLILNQDVYFTGDGWLKQLKAALEDGYSYIGERIKGTRDDWPNGYIHGTFMYLTRELIDKTGLFNQRDFPLWGSTAEYQLRAARNGFSVLPLERVNDFVHTRPDGEQFGESITKLLREESSKRSLFVSTPPLVSVIIPVHGEKYAKFLSSTVNSLVGGSTDMGLWNQQTLAGFEVVIVDDSSPDNTPDIIKSVVDPWKGVRSIRLNRSKKEYWDNKRDKYTGKVVALNAGISAAYGKYILTLDADDMIRPDRIERMYRVQVANPHAFVYDNFQFMGGGEILEFTYPESGIRISDNGRLQRYPHPKAGEATLFPNLGDYDFETLIYKNHVHNSIMFPIAAWKEIGGYPVRFRYGREDWAMAVKLGVHGYCGIRLKGYHGLLYRREGQNRTIENTRPTWMKYFQTQMRKEFKPIYQGVRPMGCCGKGAKGKSRNQAFAPGAGIEIASEGTTRLEYIGARSKGASFNVWGYFTLTQYRVTPGKSFPVDNRDLIDNTRKKRGLLEIAESGKRMFRTERVAVVPKEEAPVNDDVEAVVIQESNVEDIPDMSVLNGTVAVFQIALKENDYTEDELELLLAYERANNNRKTIIGKIDKLLKS